jgi:acetyl-CoA acyltransferase
MSPIPMEGSKPSPNPWLAENYPASLLTMGLTAELCGKHYGVSREDQDALRWRAMKRRWRRSGSSSLRGMGAAGIFERMN